MRPGPTGDRSIFTVTTHVDRRLAGDPKAMRKAKEELVARLDHMCGLRGYTILTVNQMTDPPAGPADPIMMRLEAVVEPRMDGEWPSIRAAIEQDEEDRRHASEARTTVHGRLDALKAASDVWGDRELNGRWRPLDGRHRP